MPGTTRPHLRRRALLRWLLAPLVLLAGCGGSTVTVVSDRSAPPTSSSSTTTARSSSSLAARTSTTSTPSSTATTPTATTATTLTTSQTSQAANVSCGSTAHGFVTGISGTGVACSTAVQVADGWLAELQKGLNPAKTISVNAGATFACAGTFHGSAAAVLCQANGSSSRPRVSFHAHS